MKEANKKIIQKYSYGVLLFTGRSDDRKYLIVQNRDSESFIYFFLAWNIEKWNEHYLLRVVRGFSRDELNRLLYYPFDIIYTDLYVNHVKGTFQKQYNRAMFNYNYFHSRTNWVKLCQNIQTTEIKWGFSKGRIESGEHPYKCAIRELQEEVGIVENDIVLQQHMNPVHYRNEKLLFKTCVNVCLFPAECPYELPVIYQQFNNTIRCVSVSNEILHAKWVSLEDAFFMLPTNLYRLLYEFHIANHQEII
jgi:8-oxo-dGTP pyrophosphatase MutT (NUDIX family)